MESYQYPKLEKPKTITEITETESHSSSGSSSSSSSRSGSGVSIWSLNQPNYISITKRSNISIKSSSSGGTQTKQSLRSSKKMSNISKSSKKSGKSAIKDQEKEENKSFGPISMDSDLHKTQNSVSSTQEE